MSPFHCINSTRGRGEGRAVAKSVLVTLPNLPEITTIGAYKNKGFSSRPNSYGANGQGTEKSGFLLTVAWVQSILSTTSKAIVVVSEFFALKNALPQPSHYPELHFEHFLGCFEEKSFALNWV